MPLTLQQPRLKPFFPAFFAALLPQPVSPSELYFLHLSILLSRNEALDYVAGYTCMNAGTVRDWISKGTQNCPAKNFYRSGGLGPWIVTADEVPDPSRLRITTRRNGDVVQDESTERMIFDVPFLIAHNSRFTVLEPGDLIATGSPGGSIAASESPEWLRQGEEIEVEIPGIGTLRNPIAAE